MLLVELRRTLDETVILTPFTDSDRQALTPFGYVPNKQVY
jgi:hypothetical protein